MRFFVEIGWQFANTELPEKGPDRVNRRNFKGIAKSLLSSRLAHYLGITVYGTVLAVCLATIIYRHAGTVEEHFAEQRQETAEVFRAAVDDRRFPMLPELIENGEHLIRIGAVKGGVYVNSIGEDQGRFGEQPELNWRDATLEQLSERLSPDRQHFDIYLRPEETVLQYGVILRVDAGPIWQSIWSHTRHEFIIGLIVGLVCAVSISVTVMLMVLGPLHKITASVLSAANDPGRAERMLTNIRQKDELGYLSGAVDELLLLVNHLFNEDLANALGIIDSLPEAALIYSGEGELLEANQAAYALFDFESRDDFTEMHNRFLRIDGTVVPVRDAVSDGLELTEAEVLLGDNWIPALIGGGAVRRHDGTLKRFFVTMSDLRPIAAEMEKLTNRKNESDAAFKDQLLRAEELRQMLDACRTLMELSDDTEKPAARMRSILPDRAIAKWLEQAIASGQMSHDGVRHGFLPPITSDDLSVERIFKSALTVVRGRSGRGAPKIVVSAKPASDKLCIFTIAEVASFEGRPRPCAPQREMDTSLHLGVLAKVLSGMSGRITSPASNGSENVVSFVLPIDRGAMSVIKGNNKRRKTATDFAEAGDNENFDLSAAPSEVS